MSPTRLRSSARMWVPAPAPPSRPAASARAAAVPAPGPPRSVAANVAALLEARAVRHGWGGLPAVREDDVTWTHGEVHHLAARAATVLARHGVRPGDRVMIALPDGVAWVVAFLATARLGAVAVLVNPELTAADHRFLAEDADVRLCLAEPQVAERFAAGPWLASDALLRAAVEAPVAPAHPVTGLDPLYVQYTSGTTGRPKGAVHRHRDLAVYHRAVGRRVLRVTSSDVLLSVSKLYFAYGFGNALVFPLFSGASSVLVPARPSPAEVAELVDRHRATVLFAVPSAYAGLVRVDGPPPPSLRAAVSAGEALPAVLEQQAGDRLGVPVLEQLGSTEAGHAFCANTVTEHVPGSLGRPVPGYTLSLRAPDGTPVPEEEGVGDLWVRGPTLMSGYLDRPDETARALVDGWLVTGDRARRGPDGTYRHLGRTDDLEMVGGIGVSPHEVERVLARSPLVGQVAVAAVLDAHGSSKLRAFVVPARPLPDERLAADQLLDSVRGEVAPFKVPRSVRFVDELPRTPTGKLRRFVVRQGTW